MSFRAARITSPVGNDYAGLEWCSAIRGKSRPKLSVTTEWFTRSNYKWVSMKEPLPTNKGVWEGKDMFNGMSVIGKAEFVLGNFMRRPGFLFAVRKRMETDWAAEKRKTPCSKTTREADTHSGSGANGGSSSSSAGGSSSSSAGGSPGVKRQRLEDCSSCGSPGVKRQRLED